MLVDCCAGATRLFFMGGSGSLSKTGYAGLVLLAASLFGGVSSLLKLAYAAGFNAADVTNAQFLIAALLLWPMAWVWPRGESLTVRQWGLLGLLGLASAGTSVAYYKALTLLPASMGIVLLFQFAWMVLVLDIVIHRRLPGMGKWAGMALIVAGTVLAVGLLGQPLGQYPWWAIGLGLLAGFSYAVTLYASAYVNPSSSPVLRAAVTVTVGGGITLFFFSPTLYTSGVLWHGLWVWGLLTAVFSQVLPQILLFVAIPRVGGRMAGVLGAVELPVAVVLAWLILGEQVSFLRWLGVLLVLAGMGVSEWPFLSRRRKTTPGVSDVGKHSLPVHRPWES
ncbi:DMT family transporter [Alicyclobacillaceae bacterium I2511]|nr:DMT family transporter [Alicyclobacillaceae bacterium I2511]